MADTPPPPYARPGQSDGSPHPRDDGDDGGDDGGGGHGRWGNGTASAAREGNAEMEEWAEDEQDDPTTDYYALLNVPRDATVGQIRSSYHSLSLRFHPDKQPPHRQERTTAYFNNVLVAYETLMNPHKRTIYDTLGIEGLKQKWWAAGVKAMDPEEFKIWLQEQVRKHQVTEVMSLVNSRGDITIALDVSGLQFKEAVEVVGPNGRRGFQLRNMPLVKLTKYVARHSFTVPLEGLGKLLTTPFPTFRGSAAKDEPSPSPSPPPKSKAQTQSHPTLTLAAFLGGIPVATQNHRRTYIASPGLSAHLAHSFPAVHPATPRCVGTVLAGLDLEAASTIFPERVVSTSVSKSFGSSRLTVKPIFSTSPLRAPPIVEASYVSSVGKRSSFFIQYNTGATPWPSATSQLLSGPPPTSLLTIGYTLQPASGAPAADDTDDTDATPPPRPPHTSRSKATETWRITATAGVLVGGGQLGLSWGRTFFLGTRIGAAPRIPGPRREGIRINIDAGTNGTSGATLAVRASRRIFTHTRIGVGLGVSAGKDGVVLSLTWTRLGQKIALPVVVAPVPDAASVLYAVLVPVAAYGLLEVAWLRPRQRARDRAEVETLGRRVAARVARGRRRAEEVVELMRGAVEAGQKRSRELGGLVVLEAVYGPRGGGRGAGAGAGAGRCADVTIAVAALVEGEQMVIPRGVTKSHITGFYDPVPGERKELRVRYLFKGKQHEITVGNSHGLVIPMRAHCVE